MTTTNNLLRYDTTTALTLIIPEEFHEKINKIRKKYDGAFPRWMPHINFIFPFIEEEHFEDTVTKLTEAFKTDNVKPFTLQLNKVEYFAKTVKDRKTKRKTKMATFHLKTDDQSGLDQVFNTIKKTLPNVQIKHPTFQAHMTLGQCEEKDFNSLRDELELDDLEFVVDKIYIIQRSKEDKSVPFKVVHKICF